MYNVVVFDVGDENRIIGLPYAEFVYLKSFDRHCEAIVECVEDVIKFAKEFSECSEEDFKIENYIYQLPLDNKNVFLNVLFTGESIHRQFMVIKK
jgi:hypothetical protein